MVSYDRKKTECYDSECSKIPKDFAKMCIFQCVCPECFNEMFPNVEDLLEDGEENNTINNRFAEKVKEWMKKNNVTSLTAPKASNK